ncbi:MAG: tetratricopeptide repeat protein [Pyrinomonadaceae bacterium]|nr:tetratricopeptide repeat protein [Pyrinomonadaceae bacterium]
MKVSRYLCVALLAFASILVSSDRLTAQDLPANRGVAIQNPPVRRKPPRPVPGQPQPPRIDEAMEEALAIGNAARDANPPRYSDAERGYRLALRLAPRDSRPSVGLGNVFLLQDRYADAVTNYSRALQLNPADRNVPAGLAIAYTLLGRLDEAEQTARRAIERNRNDAANYTALGLIMYGRENLPEAERAYRRSFELDSRNPLLPYQVGEVLRAQKRYADALPFYRQALSLINPQEQTYQPSILAAFGSALLRLGQLDEAAKQYARIIQLTPDSPIAVSSRSNLGLIYYAKGDFAQARKNWQEAARLNTAYAPVHIGLLILDGKLREASAQLETYTREKPTDGDGWLMLGDVRRALGDEEAARIAYVRAGQLVPEYAVLPRPSLQSLMAPVAQ